MNEGIQEIERRRDSELERPAPNTTLEVLEKRDSERAWQKLLRYFFDPGEPHGLEAGLGSALLASLQSAGLVDQGHHPDWSKVLVRKETPGDSSQPDLLVYEPGEWFFCFELKVRSKERPGQTVEHVNSSKLGDLDKADIPEDRHHYLYVAPPWSGDGEAEEFDAVPWAGTDQDPTIVGAISDALEDTGDGVPDRTVSQLEEFTDTISGVISMTDIDKETEDLKNLYLEHRNDIEQVLEAKEEYADWFFETRVPAALNAEYSPTYWGEDWEYNSYSGHTKLNRSSWRPGGDIDVHLEYYPSAAKLFGGKIHIRFDIEFKGNGWEASNGRRPQQVFTDELVSHLDTGDLPDRADISYKETSGIHKFLDIKYEFAMESEEDYLAALQSALEDMEPLVPWVDEVIGRWNDVAQTAREN